MLKAALFQEGILAQVTIFFPQREVWRTTCSQEKFYFILFQFQFFFLRWEVDHLLWFHVVRKKNNNKRNSQQSPFFLRFHSPSPYQMLFSFSVTVILKSHQNIHQEDMAIHLLVFLSRLGSEQARAARQRGYKARWPPPLPVTCGEVDWSLLLLICSHIIELLALALGQGWRCCVGPETK